MKVHVDKGLWDDTTEYFYLVRQDNREFDLASRVGIRSLRAFTDGIYPRMESVLSRFKRENGRAISFVAGNGYLGIAPCTLEQTKAPRGKIEVYETCDFDADGTGTYNWLNDFQAGCREVALMAELMKRKDETSKTAVESMRRNFGNIVWAWKEQKGRAKNSISLEEQVQSIGNKLKFLNGSSNLYLNLEVYAVLED